MFACDWYNIVAKYWYYFYSSGQAYSLEAVRDGKGNRLLPGKTVWIDGGDIEVDEALAWV